MPIQNPLPHEQERQVFSANPLGNLSSRATLRNVDSMRISNIWLKALYILGGFALIFLAAFLLKPIGTYSKYAFPAFLFVLVITGARLFQGHGYEDNQRRPWWRFTSSAPAGWVLAGIFSVVSITDIVGLTSSSQSEPYRFFVFTVDLVLAFGYINSSIRLRRLRLKRNDH